MTGRLAARRRYRKQGIAVPVSDRMGGIANRASFCQGDTKRISIAAVDREKCHAHHHRRRPERPERIAAAIGTTPRIALFMHRYGLKLYRTDWDASTEEIEYWSILAAQPAVTAQAPIRR